MATRKTRPKTSSLRRSPVGPPGPRQGSDRPTNPTNPTDPTSPINPAASSHAAPPVHPARTAISIDDVARDAEVSIATVSRVLNSPHLVSPKTSARVQEVIDKLGYVPNAFAQGLSRRTSRVLGIALPDIFGEFYSELLRGADAKASAHGYHLLVTSEAGGRTHPNNNNNNNNNNNSNNNVGHKPATLTGTHDRPRQGSLAFGIIDGLALMIAEPDEELLRQAAESPSPVVVLDSDIHGSTFDSVVVDNAKGTAEAVRHLLDNTDPARTFFVGGPKENFDTQARAAAFLATLRDRAHGTHARTPNDRASDDAALSHPQTYFGTYEVGWGRSWVTSMVASGQLKPGSSVLCGNDEIALGVMQAALDAGLRVPDHLRIVGFDDTRLASLVRPALSSVHVPMSDVGAAAISLLIRRLEERTAPIERVTLPTSLVVRQSS